MLGLGCVLTQVSDFEKREDEQVLGYGFRSLRGAESNWHIHKIEAFAVVWGINHYRHYLKGKKFILITDHSSLVYLFRPLKATPKLSRWCAAVQEYDFDIIYKPGSSNIADPLSRCIPFEDFKERRELKYDMMRMFTLSEDSINIDPNNFPLQWQVIFVLIHRMQLI